MILFCLLWTIEGRERFEKMKHKNKLLLSKMFPIHDRVHKERKKHKGTLVFLLREQGTKIESNYRDWCSSMVRPKLASEFEFPAPIL